MSSLRLNPFLNEGLYVFCTIPDPKAIPISDILMVFKESEGTTIILKKELADQYQLEYTYVASWITLGITTSLNMIGLTAKFSHALANAGISCNVVAAYHHDHFFVDERNAVQAIKILEALSI